MIGAIENAIIDRIRLASEAGALGYRLATVTSYGGEFDDNVNTAVINFPAVWVTFAREERDPVQTGEAEWQFFPSFMLMCAARNFRNERATRHGAPSSGRGEVGSYQILRDVRALLQGQDLGLPIMAMWPGPSSSVFTDETFKKKLSVLALEMRTSYEEIVQAQASEIGDFTHFHADWDVPPHTVHDAVPLAAGTADATDDVTLEG